MPGTMPCGQLSQTTACASGMLTKQPCRQGCSSPAALAMWTWSALWVSAAAGLCLLPRSILRRTVHVCVFVHQGGRLGFSLVALGSNVAGEGQQSGCVCVHGAHMVLCVFASLI